MIDLVTALRDVLVMVSVLWALVAMVCLACEACRRGCRPYDWEREHDFTVRDERRARAELYRAGDVIALPASKKRPAVGRGA